MKQSFDNLAQRMLYGYKSFYSDFSPAKSDTATEECQRELHTFLRYVIDIVCENPTVLKLPIVADTEDFYTDLTIRKEYQKIAKMLHDFYAFMHEAGICGIINDDGQFILHLQAFKEKKIVVRPPYFDLLSQAGMNCTKTKDEIVFTYKDPTIFHAWKFLSEVDVTLDWEAIYGDFFPAKKFVFALCALDGKADFLFPKIEKMMAWENGFLDKCDEKVLTAGYYKSKVRAGIRNTEMDFRITYAKEVCVFSIIYSTNGGMIFGSFTHQGFKAMLKDFDNLDEDIQAHIVKIARKCKGAGDCGVCNKKGNFHSMIDVNFNGDALTLCSDWPSGEMNMENIDFHIKFFDLQDKYATV